MNIDELKDEYEKCWKEALKWNPMYTGTGDQRKYKAQCEKGNHIVRLIEERTGEKVKKIEDVCGELVLRKMMK